MFTKIKNLIKVWKMKKLEKLAEIKTIQIKEMLKKLYQLIAIVEKSHCRTRMARRQFRRDVINRGFIHAMLMNKLLKDRGSLEDVLKIYPEKIAVKQYKLIKKLVRKKKINKMVAKELRNQTTNVKVK